MKKELKMYDGDMIAEYEETDELKQKVFDAVIKFCLDHNASTGESMQNDDFNIDSPEFMANIIDDLLCFKTRWID